MEIEILFEDDVLLVVNKPSGLLTQASVDRKRPDIYSILQKKYPYIALHHRLDSGTSGVLLLCKNRNFNKEVSAMFKEREAHKKYLAVCFKKSNKNIPDSWIVENYLGRRKNTRNNKAIYCSVQSGGDPAKTEFTKLKENETNVLLQAEPYTGRTHQIRVHLYEYGLPILGDLLYTKRDIPKAPRLLLHAQELEVIHPKTKKPIRFQAPVPPEFRID